MPKSPTDAELCATMYELLAERGPGKSICPSEVPRKLMGEQGAWRAHLKRTRELAKPLIAAGQVLMLKKGKPVDPSAVKGVVRLAQGAGFASAPSGFAGAESVSSQEPSSQSP